jgi:hypothetical protein
MERIWPKGADRFSLGAALPIDRDSPRNVGGHAADFGTTTRA